MKGGVSFAWLGLAWWLRPCLAGGWLWGWPWLAGGAGPSSWRLAAIARCDPAWAWRAAWAGGLQRTHTAHIRKTHTTRVRVHGLVQHLRPEEEDDVRVRSEHAGLTNFALPETAALRERRLLPPAHRGSGRARGVEQPMARGDSGAQQVRTHKKGGGG